VRTLKRALTWGCLLSAIGAAVFVGTRIAGAESLIPKVDATYLVRWTLPKSGDVLTNALGQENPYILGLATFTDSGQVLASDQAFFGLISPNPTFSSSDNTTDDKCAFAGELRGAGQGSWRRTGLNVDFMVLWIRFDGCGRPHGFMRSRGRGTPTIDGGVIGTSFVEFFEPGVDPLNGDPSQRISLPFVAARVNARLGTTEIGDNDDIPGK
jgi:hypothetical protein